MQYETFLERVQQEANLDNRDDAEQLITVIFATLAEPLSRDETNRLASQLPSELKRLLNSRLEKPTHFQTWESYNPEEFYNRVKGRLNISYQQGVQQVTAVMRVLVEAVPNTIISGMLKDLPEGYSTLFTQMQR